MTPLLEVRRLARQFEGVRAVADLNFALNSGEILGLIGPNGAGKTTTFNIIAGNLKPSAGEVWFSGRNVSGSRPHEMARLGLMRTFQHNMPFNGLSLLDNVLVGTTVRTTAGFFADVVGTPQARREQRRFAAEALELLRSVGLETAPAHVDKLSFGQGRLLEIARALAAQPLVILLDEPAAGLTRTETDGLASIIRRVSSMRVAVLLIEHDMDFLMQLADRVVVMARGEKISEGTSAQVSADPRVREAYLGPLHAAGT